ncbi:MAG: DNA repair protein RadA [Anaerovoracaceae bacterium]
MAKKTKTVFVCQECGYETPKWQGQCICGAWNSMVEEKVLPVTEQDNRRRGTFDIKGKAKADRLKDVKSDGNIDRVDTGISELNRVLGGGIVKGSLTLISGEPGIGKSTIIMQAASNISAKGLKVLYVSGEESEEQLKLRADRICGEISNEFFVLAETNIENIEIITKEMEPDFIIIDSIQTTYSSAIDSAPGSVSQVRYCGNEFMRIGKMAGIPIFIVAHVTKSGELAGPKIVEHLVDCVLHFTGERNHELRILRSFKNRFGTTSEIGAFEMEGTGLVEIKNLSKTFLEGLDGNKEGSIVGAVYEGTRPLLLEIQALTSPTNVGFARRTVIGIESSRLNMIIAVLERKVGLSLLNQDVFVNVVGGIRPEGTSTDLAVALAIHSSYRDVVPDNKTIAIGEIGLTGDLRSVQNAEKIVKEAIRMGFRNIILPHGNAKKLSNMGESVKIISVRDINDAIHAYGASR